LDEYLLLPFIELAAFVGPAGLAIGGVLFFATIIATASGAFRE